MTKRGYRQRLPSTAMARSALEGARFLAQGVIPENHTLRQGEKDALREGTGMFAPRSSAI